MFKPEFEKLHQVFHSLLHEQKLHSAAQIAVLRDGQVLVDHAEGTGSYTGIDTNTPFLCFSISKAFTGLCIHHLIETGRIELDAPIAQYWPEFGCKGKESATIRHVFLHQAGIPAPELNRQVFTWPYWKLVTRNVAQTKAVFTPGAQTAYHVVNYGFIFGEVIYRVSGMHVEDYLSRYFTQPLGLNYTWMRIPRRMLAMTPRIEAKAPSTRDATILFNLPVIRTARIPAANLHSTARELAAAFQMLLDGGVTAAGVRLLQPETILAATRSGYNGYDGYIKTNMNWGYGFILGGGANRSSDPEQRTLGRCSTEETFSAMGMGTNMVWVDRRTRTVVAFTCNGMLGNEAASRRWSAISNAAWDGVQAMDGRSPDSSV